MSNINKFPKRISINTFNSQLFVRLVKKIDKIDWRLTFKVQPIVFSKTRKKESQQQGNKTKNVTKGDSGIFFASFIVIR